VSIWTIGGVSGLLFAGLVLLFRAMAGSRRTAYESPSGNLVGQSGTTVTPLGPQGSVRVAGETWSAVSATGESIAGGAEIVVVEMDGLTVKVTEPGG
jgi:membrane-bound ClpP family serine protease